MRDILRRYQPTRIEDLTALNALYRPGPIQGGMIDDFINRKHGKTKVAYELPQLKEILEETYGVILYQEQVMQIANLLASFSLGEGWNLLRQRHGQKEKGRDGRAARQFLAGCEEKQNSRKESRAYLRPDGRVRRLRLQQVALLRLCAACLSNGLTEDTLPRWNSWPRSSPPKHGNAEKQVKYINEARGMSISILPPDVNEANLYFTPVGDSIRFGFAAIKNVGENTAKAIRESRLSPGRIQIALRILRNASSRASSTSAFRKPH